MHSVLHPTCTCAHASLLRLEAAVLVGNLRLPAPQYLHLQTLNSVCLVAGELPVRQCRLNLMAQVPMQSICWSDTPIRPPFSQTGAPELHALLKVHLRLHQNGVE